MTPQSTFMIVATVRDAHLDSLQDLLASMNKSIGLADPNNSLVPFARFERLHMARFVIIEATTAHEIKAFGVRPRPWRPTLAFIGDIDGDRDSFLAELATIAAAGLEQIFACCEGFPDANPSGLLNWLKTHNVKPGANYVNWLGRTVKQIQEEAALQRSLSTYLHDKLNAADKVNIHSLRQNLLSHIEIDKHAGRLTLTPEVPTPCRWQLLNWLHLLGIPLLLLLLLPFFIVIFPVWALRLRTLERSDPELFIRPDREYVKKLTAQEDHDISNQYSVFGDVKPGFFRLWTFKFLLLLTDYLARHLYNHGFLARIRTIHFARWVFMDDDHRVFFASNYDGSHESYMDDFINKVGCGLNLTFGNAVGYPSTQWLLKGGAEREQVFKYTQRRHQIPTQVWYKAYPGLTATDLARNSRIRKGVEIRQKNDQAIRDWLSEI